MPTRLTRTAGTFAIVAALAWLAVVPTSLIGAGSAEWEVHYFTLALHRPLLASVCTTVALFGLLRRAGSARGVLAGGCSHRSPILGTLVLGSRHVGVDRRESGVLTIRIPWSPSGEDWPSPFWPGTFADGTACSASRPLITVAAPLGPFGGGRVAL